MSRDCRPTSTQSWREATDPASEDQVEGRDLKQDGCLHVLANSTRGRMSLAIQVLLEVYGSPFSNQNNVGYLNTVIVHNHFVDTYREQNGATEYRLWLRRTPMYPHSARPGYRPHFEGVNIC